MTLEDLIEQLQRIAAVHRNAEVAFEFKTERGEIARPVVAVEYWHNEKKVVLK